MSELIKRNRIKCVSCKQIIESVYRHDFVQCKCGKIAVDGGKDYLRRLGERNEYIELSEIEDTKNVKHYK